VSFDYGKMESMLPHKGRMVLLDRVIHFDLACGSIHTEVTIRPSSMFFNEREQQVPAYVGMEYMAQSIAAYSFLSAAGIAGSAAEPQIGFLLGTRKYCSSVHGFTQGQILRIEAAMQFNENKLASFQCNIHERDLKLAEALITAYQPGSVKELLDKVNERSS